MLDALGRRFRLQPMRRRRSVPRRLRRCSALMGQYLNLPAPPVAVSRAPAAPAPAARTRAAK